MRKSTTSAIIVTLHSGGNIYQLERGDHHAYAQVM